MRLQYKLFFLLMLVLASCSEGEKPPADVINEDRMAGILAEVHIVDGDMVSTASQGDSLYKYGMGHYVALFKKYHTDTAKFNKSFTWYTKHPDKLNFIYANVIKILEKQTDSLNKIPSSLPDPAANKR